MEEFNVQQVIEDSLREIKTPFGVIYIERWGDHAPREDMGRITIYDSRKDWMDYFTLDYFYDAYDPESKGTEEEQAEAAYEALVEMLELGAEEQTCEGFIDWLGLNFVYVGTDKAKAADALSDGHPEELLPDEIETNEYVNHIGDNYIVIDY